MKNTAQKQTIDLSIVLLNYKTRDLTLTAIKSVFQSRISPFTFEVILCDNGSDDGIGEAVKAEFPKVQFIQNGGNIGFSAGNNPGIQRARGRYVLLLNTDTEVTPDTLSGMLSFMDADSSIGAATCKLLLPDGSIDPACHRGFPTPWRSFAYMSKLTKLFPKSRFFAGYHMTYLDFSTVHDVDMISGAFFLVRRDVIEKVGLLDEEYLMYGEDMDWCMRIKEAGYRIIYNPNFTVLHKKKQSGRAHADRARRVRTKMLFYRYNHLFFTKNYSKKYGFFVRLAVDAMFYLRIFIVKVFAV